MRYPCIPFHPARSAALLVTLLLVGVLPFAPRAEPASPVRTVDIGELLRTQQYALAEQLLRRHLAAKADPGAEYLLGFTLLQTYRYVEAESYLRNALRQDPSRDDWLMALAQSLLEQGQYRAAADMLSRAIKLRPRGSYYHGRAMCALNMGDLAAAESDLRSCLAEEPGHADALFRLGEILLDQGKFSESIQYLQASLVANPDNLEARYRLGVNHGHLAQTREAEAAYRGVLARIPGHVGALHNLASLLIRNGRQQEGRELLDEFSRMSKLRDEIEFHRHALQLDPDNFDGRLSLVHLLLRIGDNQEALKQLLQARGRAPGDPRVYDLLSSVFERLGDQTNAGKASAFADQLRGR